MSRGFLPVNRKDMEEAGLDRLDFVYVCGDAYVDHPSFGSAIIGRILQAHGYTVGMICQPDWKIRRTYKHTPIIIGGIEASLRRLGHYDYWSDKVRRSILLDSGADLVSYGMGEHSIVEIADALDSGLDVRDVTFIRGTVFKTRDASYKEDALLLPSFEEILRDKEAYARSYAVQHRNTDPFRAKKLCETYDGSLFVIQNPPAFPLTTREMDDVYALPYMRAWHPSYEQAGGVPALSEIKFSLTSNRGCFGDCNFCALTFHEGRIVQARSHASILEEARACIGDPDFKGYIHDVGGPTAEFRKPACSKQMKVGACQDRKCLYPKPCPNLEVDHKDYLSLLKKIRSLPGVKKVFVRSGFRFDYLMADRNREFLRELVEHHVSGQLRTAPEHISDNVLKRMGKPSVDVYNAFVREFEDLNRKLHKKQYIVPYLMSSHPGSTMKDAIALAEYIRELGYMPEQVQDFYPTPGTVSTCMYYTGLDPLTMEKVYVAVDPHEKAMQRALIQYRDPANYDLVKEALLREGRQDLIGFGEKCLIPPRKISRRPAADRGKQAERRAETGRSRTPDRPGGRQGRSGRTAAGRHPGSSAGRPAAGKHQGGSSGRGKKTTDRAGRRSGRR